MTSKRLFLKGMREDMRHKIWMLALSFLGSFLTMPVLWLLYYSDVDIANTDRWLSSVTPQEQALAIAGTLERMAEFFRHEMMVATGVIAIVGAVIVGLEGFRYLQQKSMVDTYHSLPVSKLQLFGVKYVNGVLIWLVPYLLCLILTLVFSAVVLARIGGLEGLSTMIWEAGINTVVLIASFLLIYHLMLLATMLTGNLLNTLAAAVVLGGGVIAAYGIGMGFMITYLHTYYARGGGLLAALYGSPMAAPAYLIVSRVEDESLFLGFPVAFTLKCLAVALAMGGLALFAYLKRPSERAGRGLELKGVAGTMRVCVSVLGGMGGWLFMYSLIGGSANSTAWGIFGTLLTGILVYGVLDVIFSMDFKAFFRHKWSMAASMVLTLLICFGFKEDWLGYDRYLPEQKDIQKVSIACYSYRASRQLGEMLEEVELTDTAQIHAFLERGIENAFGRTHKPGEVLIEEAYYGELYAEDTFYVEVTLANGLSYCRVYPYYKWDEDVVLPLLCSEEYARGAYYLSEDMIDACIQMRSHSGVYRETTDEKVFREVAEAYNQDLLERPGAVILGEDRMMVRLYMRIQQYYTRNITLDIFEGMTHTLEAMERNGLWTFVQLPETEKVESITFEVNGSGYRYQGDAALDPTERSIRNYFGVYPDGLPMTEEGAYESRFETAASAESDQQYSFVITDPEEIEEVLALIQYSSMAHSGGVFVRDFVTGVTILDEQGAEWSVCVRRGALPEKYILRFLEEAKTQE